MSYEDARECFQDIKRYISDPRKATSTNADKALFDLANGLTMLTNAIQNDMDAISRRLQQIEKREAGR